MKRLFLSLLTILAFGSVCADEVTISDVQIMQGKSGNMEVQLKIDTDTYYRELQFDLYLPENIIVESVTEDGVTQPAGVAGEAASKHTLSSNYIQEDEPQSVRYTLINTKGVAITEGVVVIIPLTSSETLKVGDKLTASIKNVVLSTGAPGDTHEQIEYKEIPFNIEIIEDRITLDENSTEVPGTYTNQNVKVLRTINANEWSTICLPFAMTADQVKDAFGEDVLFADFTGYEATSDGSNVTAINVKFNSLNATSEGLIANHPCLIKVSKAVTEFIVNGVDVVPEDNPTIAAVERTKKQWSELIGNYTAEKVLGEDGCVLFLSGGKFYYTNGKSKMKAYRAYFDFYDELEDKTVGASAKIGFSVDDVTDGIDGLRTSIPAEGIYDLSGRKIKVEGDDLSRLPKGVYIVDGKKVTVK